ncbi:MAG: hypothetical protein ACI9NC_003717, partial [Verrucomicrobiales bacterium]
ESRTFLHSADPKSTCRRGSIESTAIVFDNQQHTRVLAR